MCIVEYPNLLFRISLFFKEGETVVSTTLHIQRKREGVILLNVLTNYHTGLVILGFDG